MVFGKLFEWIEMFILGFVVFELFVYGDFCGWFKENWQCEKMIVFGFEDFGLVQNNILFNDVIGMMCGIYVELWDKWVFVVIGCIFGVWVDLWEGLSFGIVFMMEFDFLWVIFVFCGVGNFYQIFEMDIVYIYFVNDYWLLDVLYLFLNLVDEIVVIDWLIFFVEVEIFVKDKVYLCFVEVMLILLKWIFVLGVFGQFGFVLWVCFGDVVYIEYVMCEDIDVMVVDLVDVCCWWDYGFIVNVVVYMVVDQVEILEGCEQVWVVNVMVVVVFVCVVMENGIIFVYVFSDYVFDGIFEGVYIEDVLFCLLGVYGQIKVVGDFVVLMVVWYYIVCIFWVIGEGGNFVCIMYLFVEWGIDFCVVGDQVGCFMFMLDIVDVIVYLVEMDVLFGVYNVMGLGDVLFWVEIVCEVFWLVGYDFECVILVSMDEYFVIVVGLVVFWLCNSVFDFMKIVLVGFLFVDVEELLCVYVVGLKG